MVAYWGLGLGFFLVAVGSVGGRGKGAGDKHTNDLCKTLGEKVPAPCFAVKGISKHFSFFNGDVKAHSHDQF